MHTCSLKGHFLQMRMFWVPTTRKLHFSPRANSSKSTESQFPYKSTNDVHILSDDSPEMVFRKRNLKETDANAGSKHLQRNPHSYVCHEGKIYHISEFLAWQQGRLYIPSTWRQNWLVTVQFFCYKEYYVYVYMFWNKELGKWRILRGRAEIWNLSSSVHIDFYNNFPFLARWLAGFYHR